MKMHSIRPSLLYGITACVFNKIPWYFGTLKFEKHILIIPFFDLFLNPQLLAFYLKIPSFKYLYFSQVIYLGL
jgi:hypothetical protein